MGRLLAACLIGITLMVFIASPNVRGGEENDLWLILSSYEDISINVGDLAFFLATHGYNAIPKDNYVIVQFSSGNEVYLTPNGASPRLADLWMTTPQDMKGPVMVLPPDAVRTDVTLNKSADVQFFKSLSKYAIFPVTPPGMCYDGSQELYDIYESFDYYVIFLYDPSQYESQGHLWVAVENPSQVNTWLAVDSYYGIIEEDDYYIAPYSFIEFKYLDSINPKWRLV